MVALSILNFESTAPVSRCRSLHASRHSQAVGGNEDCRIWVFTIAGGHVMLHLICLHWAPPCSVRWTVSFAPPRRE